MVSPVCYVFQAVLVLTRCPEFDQMIAWAFGHFKVLKSFLEDDTERKNGIFQAAKNWSALADFR